MEPKEGEIHAESEEKLKEDTKKISVREGIAASVMTGAGSNYITPYALAVGASNTQIGLLTSVPSLLGNLSQLFSAKAIEKYSRKRVIVTAAFLQALMWVPLLAVGYFFFFHNLNKGLSASLVILFYTFYILFGSFLSPAWNSLMKDVVSKNKGNYFGRRNKITGAVSLTVMLAAGFLLNYLTNINLFLGFAILFGVAFTARLVSNYLLTKYYDPKLNLEKGYYFSFWSFVKRIPQSNFGKFAVFISLISFATAIASPFFAVYMLKELKFNYTIWTIVTISSSLSSLLFMPLWGRFADKFGNLKVLQFTGFFIPLLPIAWFFSSAMTGMGLPVLIAYLIIVELLSGLIWAGFNLCAVNFIYDAVTRQKCALCIAYYNILNGAGVFIGATLGGLLSSFNFGFLQISPLLFIFILSGVVRMAVYFFMIPLIKEVREVEKYKDGELGEEFRKMLLPIQNRFTLVPQGRPVGSTSTSHSGN